MFTVYLSLLNIFKDILEYFLENMGGRYGRVYLGLLGINVLHKFLGFLVDAEICQMDKVVEDLFWVVGIRLCSKPGCQLLPTVSHS